MVCRTELSMSRLLNILTILVILIASMGLTGLTLLIIQQRTKEIGIRKVLGAGFSDILYLLNKEYIKWILMSVIFACPLTFYLVSEWLQGFAYRIDIPVGLFVGVAAASILMILVITSYQSINAALQNPSRIL